MKITETIHTNGPKEGGGLGLLRARTYVPRGEVGAEYTTYGRTDDTVYKTTSIMLGDTAASGKIWRRPRLESLVVFSWRRGGRMRVYRKSRVSGRNGRRTHGYIFTDDTTTYLMNNLTVDPKMEETLLAHTAAKSLRGLAHKEYPLVADFPPEPGITPYLRHNNVQDFTRDFYGPSRYRKDLVRGVANRGWLTAGGARYLLFTKAIAPMIPVDWIAGDLLDMPEPTFADLALGRNPRDYRQTRRLLRTASPKQIRALWKDRAALNRHGAWLENDTFRSWDQIRLNDPNYRLEDIVFDGWKSLHDILAEDQRRIRTRNQTIKHDKAWAALMGSYGEYTVVIPEDTHTLIKWGGQMANCIGGYTSQAVSNHTFLFAVMRGDAMICNMEITPKGELRQMVGKHNSTLSEEDHDAILAIVEGVYGKQRGQYVGRRLTPGQEALVEDGLADWERELLYPAPVQDRNFAGLDF